MESRPLAEQLRALRVQSASLQSGSRYFVPYDMLLEILSYKSIHAIISGIDRIRDDERQLFATLIKERFPKVFAVLLRNGHERYLPEFLYRLEYDARLHFSKIDLNFLPDDVADEFVEHQWEFIPIVFEKGALHRKLRSDLILPFLEDKKIGGGGFGEVFKVKLHPRCQRLIHKSHQQDAVYVVRKQISASLVTEHERAVLEIVRKIRHPNIVELLGSYDYGENLNLLFPLADTDLKAFFRSGSRMPAEAVCSGIYGLADALSNIHKLSFTSEGVESRRIGYHHDLRPANILLTGKIFTLADFGLAKLKTEDETSKSRLRGGQQDYLSPEAFDEIEWQNGVVGRALDIWAFGCILAEFATYLQGASVEEFHEARKFTHRHGYFQITDSAFHLNRSLRPAVNDWLLTLVSNSPRPETSKTIELSREMLKPSWRHRIEISAVVDRLGAIALDSKVATIMEYFSQLISAPNRRHHHSRIFMLLERDRLSAWYQAYRFTDRDTKEARFKQSLTVVEQLQECLSSYTARHSETSNIPVGPQLPPEIQVICDIIDKLGVGLPKHVQEEMDQLWTKSITEIDDADLAQMRVVPMPSRYRTVGIKGAMKYMSGAISKSIRFGAKSMLVDPGIFDEDANFDNDLSGRTTGDCNGVRAILEWIEYDVRWLGERGDEMLSRMEALAKLWNSEQTSRTGVLAQRILNCLGYFHDRQRQRFGVIYAIPSPTPTHKASKCFSLHSIIHASSKERIADEPKPFLGDVFSLACGIVECVAALHEIGWLHKGICSQNILVFSPTREDVCKTLASGVIAGLSYSRPEDSGTMSYGPFQAVVFYQHPKYIEPTATFERRYDFFAAGMVLLEVGLWYTMQDFLDNEVLYYPSSEELAEKNRIVLLEKYVPQLGERMGKLYQDAVAFCLDVEGKVGSFLDNAEGRWATQQAFRKNVVEPLARCFA